MVYVSHSLLFGPQVCLVDLAGSERPSEASGGDDERSFSAP